MCVCVSTIYPLRPWVLGAVGSPPLSSLVTFASIVEEEKQQEAALIRSREKPLALIQVTHCVCVSQARTHTHTLGITDWIASVHSVGMENMAVVHQKMLLVSPVLPYLTDFYLISIALCTVLVRNEVSPVLSL